MAAMDYHQLLLPTVTTHGETALRSYGDVPIFVMPLYFVPIGLIISLLVTAAVMVGKGISVHAITAVVFRYGSWPSGMDNDALTDDAMTERELVCAAIELLDQPGGRRAPDSFRCPISLTIMRDPVVTSDGHTYEREQARNFLARCGPSSPLTKQRMAAR